MDLIRQIISLFFSFIYGFFFFFSIKSFFHYILSFRGRFVFSCGHPMDSCAILKDYSNNYVEIDGKKYYLISDYNNEGKRTSHWFVDGVETYHRNVSHLLNGLIDAGFSLEHITESYANDDVIKLNPKFKDQKDHSYFIFFKCKK